MLSKRFEEFSMARAFPLSFGAALFAASMLTACGPGAASADNAPLPPRQDAQAALVPPDSSNTNADAATQASTPIASAESSLAADSRQVAPVLSFAPETTTSNSN
jgi:hypothetical protein